MGRVLVAGVQHLGAGKTALVLLVSTIATICEAQTDNCAIHNINCKICHTDGGASCTWCPDNRDVKGSSPCVPVKASGSCPLTISNSRCGSQCTAKTCPPDSTCTDGADMKPVCRCNAGFRAIDSLSGRGIMCVPIQTGASTQAKAPQRMPQAF
jgi:hypothetical protein